MQRSDLNLLSEAYSNVNNKRQLLAESAYYWNIASIKELFKNASDEVINESWESFKGNISEGLIGDTIRGAKEGWTKSRENAVKTNASAKFINKTLAAFNIELAKVAKILKIDDYQNLTLAQLTSALTYPAPPATGSFTAPAAPKATLNQAPKAASTYTAPPAAPAAPPAPAVPKSLVPGLFANR